MNLKPKSLLWELTLSCNLNCSHCAASAGKKREDELSTEEALEVCGQVYELGVPAVCLMGGEVFLRNDWDLIAATLRNLGIDVGLITNGFSFNNNIIGKIISLGLNQIGISLDAASPYVHDKIRGREGAHARALETIKKVNQLPVYYKNVITSVSKNNIGELEGILRWLMDNTEGFAWIINFSTCHNPVRFGKENIITMEEYIKVAKFINSARPENKTKINISGTHDLGHFSQIFPNLHDFGWKGCLAGIEYLGIESNGNVKGCLVLSDKHIVGNVRKRSLKEIWDDPDSFKLNRHFKPELLEGDCKGCPYGEICKGGCRDFAESLTGLSFYHPFCLYRWEKDIYGKKLSPICSQH